MKQCFKCKQTKHLRDFYKHKKMRDGHLNKCKECIKEDVRLNRLENIDHYREYDRDRGNRQSPEYIKEYRQQNPAKYKATNAVNNALRDGRLERKTECEKCGKQMCLHAHHHDYSKPLDVVWLCASCHRREHV